MHQDCEKQHWTIRQIEILSRLSLRIGELLLLVQNASQSIRIDAKDGFVEQVNGCHLSLEVLIGQALSLG